jgi:glycosyltransferase involved in cell wall biosynthesis
MIIITYSETNAETIEQNLGKAEYSYYFIYKKYLPAMRRLGTLVAVNDPATEVDRIYRENPDEQCIFLSFSPPHRTVLELECPTVCVFAWEFSTIPEEHWHDKPEYNWARVLQQLGNALTISEYAAEVVRKAIPEGLNLAVLPAAVDTAPTDSLRPKPQGVTINVKATLYDSRSYNLSTDMVTDEVSGSRDPLKMEPWDDSPIDLSFTENDPDSIELLIGFYSSEDWGTWSRTGSPWIKLPHNVSGPVIIELELVAFGTNIDREISVQLGSEEVRITLSGLLGSFTFTFDPQTEADMIKFHNLDLTHAPGARDHRSLGIGITSMSMRRPDDYKQASSGFFSRGLNRLRSFVADRILGHQPTAGSNLELQGIVYSTVLNPEDGRKNWEDLVTAFCWAFREEENATLVLKMTHRNLGTFLGKLLLLYSQMSPFKCRVVAVHGFLTDTQYQALMDSTHFVVNSSHCEGQCLPLMEFMGQGVPAIAPNHTAMKDYIDESNALIIKSSVYPTFWPIDARRAIRTLCYRIDWNSLMEAYRQSFDIAMNQPEKYKSLRKSSIRSIEELAGQEVVYQKMKRYLEATATTASD